MSTTQTTARAIATTGLISANKGNPFWNQSQAMGLLNLVRKNNTLQANNK